MNNIILQGIVGSTAQGLAREESDIDRLGVFVAPTVDVAGLHWNIHKESKVTNDPDITIHEIGKYLRLALKCNPSVLELLWLPEFEFKVDPFGDRLLSIRDAFLSERAVRSTYCGYARQQARKLEERGDGTFGQSPHLHKRTAKHGRHLLRLLRQGRELLETGNLTVKVHNPDVYFAFDNMTTEQMLNVYASEDEAFMRAKSILPQEPDEEIVRYFLKYVRITFLTEPE